MSRLHVPLADRLSYFVLRPFWQPHWQPGTGQNEPQEQMRFRRSFFMTGLSFFRVPGVIVGARHC